MSKIVKHDHRAPETQGDVIDLFDQLSKSQKKFNLLALKADKNSKSL